MRAEAASCPNCGANLPAEYGTVRCRYCGKETLLRAADPQRSLVVVHSGGGGSGSKLVLFVILGLVAVVGLGAALMIPLLMAAETDRTSASERAAEAVAAEATREAGRAIQQVFGKLGPQAGSANPAPSSPRRSLQSRICLLDDLDGDRVGEISGLVSQGSGREKIPAILNGASGEVVWQGESLGEDHKIHLLCVGPRWVAVVDNQRFELLLVNAHDPERQVRRALSDELDRYGVTDDCLALRTADRARQGFWLKDGSERACNMRPRRRPHIEDTTTCGIISTLRRGASFELDGISFTLTARRPGTAFLQASAKRGREELWDVPLRLVPVSGEAIGCFVGAATPGVFMVFGSPRDDDHGMTVLGLNAESGTERYAEDIDGTYGQVNEIHYNGRFVVLGLLRRAQALDPVTGQTAWRFGG